MNSKNLIIRLVALCAVLFAGVALERAAAEVWVASRLEAELGTDDGLRKSLQWKRCQVYNAKTGRWDFPLCEQDPEFVDDQIKSYKDAWLAENRDSVTQRFREYSRPGLALLEVMSSILAIWWAARWLSDIIEPRLNRFRMPSFLHGSQNFWRVGRLRRIEDEERALSVLRERGLLSDESYIGRVEALRRKTERIVGSK